MTLEQSRFDVEEILDSGFVIGRNWHVDIPVGSVFTSLRKSKSDDPRAEPRWAAACLLGDVSLRLDEVQWFRRSIDVIPRGHSAGLRLAGDGLPALVQALRERQDRETVWLHAAFQAQALSITRDPRGIGSN